MRESAGGTALTTSDRERSTAAAIARDGFLGPLPLFTRSECRRIAAHVRRDGRPASAGWEKGLAVHDRFFYELALHPLLLAAAREVLGPGVALWGVSAVEHGPGSTHPWHTDIESHDPAGRFLSAWVGIENTGGGSAMEVISRSHLAGISVQEARARRGWNREAATAAMLLEAARERVPDARVVHPPLVNGDVLFFDGRLWHATENRRFHGRRLALLFQYAAAGTPVRVPDLTQLDWPFRFRAAPRPPVILLSGEDHGANLLVPPPPPAMKGTTMLTTAIHRFHFPAGAGLARGWEPFPAFRGATRTFTDMSCHASVLAPGRSPHPPHVHDEEELLVPLEGEVELVLAVAPDDPEPRVQRVEPGVVAYYPSGQHHTIRNPGSGPASYLMFKWNAAAALREEEPLQTRIVRYDGIEPPETAGAFWAHPLFEGPTSLLGKLHAHLTVLRPGAGYAPHGDPYDVAVVTLSGSVETLGETVEPRSVVYYSAGELHGMKNAGPAPARYLVFEFHAPGIEILPEPLPMLRTARQRLVATAADALRPFWRIAPGGLKRTVRKLLRR